MGNSLKNGVIGPEGNKALQGLITRVGKWPDSGTKKKLLSIANKYVGPSGMDNLNWSTINSRSIGKVASAFMNIIKSVVKSNYNNIGNPGFMAKSASEFFRLVEANTPIADIMENTVLPAGIANMCFFDDALDVLEEGQVDGDAACLKEELERSRDDFYTAVRGLCRFLTGKANYIKPKCINSLRAILGKGRAGVPMNIKEIVAKRIAASNNAMFRTEAGKSFDANRAAIEAHFSENPPPGINPSSTSAGAIPPPPPPPPGASGISSRMPSAGASMGMRNEAAQEDAAGYNGDWGASNPSHVVQGQEYDYERVLEFDVPDSLFKAAPEGLPTAQRIEMFERSQAAVESYLKPEHTGLCRDPQVTSKLALLVAYTARDNAVILQTIKTDAGRSGMLQRTLRRFVRNMTDKSTENFMRSIQGVLPKYGLDTIRKDYPTCREIFATYLYTLSNEEIIALNPTVFANTAGGNQRLVREAQSSASQLERVFALAVPVENILNYIINRVVGNMSRDVMAQVAKGTRKGENGVWIVGNVDTEILRNLLISYWDGYSPRQIYTLAQNWLSPSCPGFAQLNVDFFRLYIVSLINSATDNTLRQMFIQTHDTSRRKFKNAKALGYDSTMGVPQRGGTDKASPVGAPTRQGAAVAGGDEAGYPGPAPNMQPVGVGGSQNSAIPSDPGVWGNRQANNSASRSFDDQAKDLFNEILGSKTSITVNDLIGALSKLADKHKSSLHS